VLFACTFWHRAVFMQREHQGQIYVKTPFNFFLFLSRSKAPHRRAIFPWQFLFVRVYDKKLTSFPWQGIWFKSWHDQLFNHENNSCIRPTRKNWQGNPLYAIAHILTVQIYMKYSIAPATYGLVKLVKQKLLKKRMFAVPTRK
jgi:hypothetical protein